MKYGVNVLLRRPTRQSRRRTPLGRPWKPVLGGRPVAPARRPMQRRSRRCSPRWQPWKARGQCPAGHARRRHSSRRNPTLSGLNLQLDSGAGSTDAPVSGLGYLFVGDNGSPGVQTGSNNLVIGDGQTFTSYGGLVAGTENAIGAALAGADARGMVSARALRCPGSLIGEQCGCARLLG